MAGSFQIGNFQSAEGAVGRGLPENQEGRRRQLGELSSSDPLQNPRSPTPSPSTRLYHFFSVILASALWASFRSTHPSSSRASLPARPRRDEGGGGQVPEPVEVSPSGQASLSLLLLCRQSMRTERA